MSGAFRPANKRFHTGGYRGGPSGRYVAPVNHDRLARLLDLRRSCALDAQCERVAAIEARGRGDAALEHEHLAEAKAAQDEFDRLNDVIASLGGTRQ